MGTFVKSDIPNWSQEAEDKGQIEMSGYYDDDYLKEIEQYKDKDWYSQLLNNPWLAGNQKQFSPNFWQSIAEAFGDTSARDRYNAELTSNRSQWLSEFLERMRQQDYNESSIGKEIQLERAAGLNPDLTGVNGSLSASENDQPIGNNPQMSDSSFIPDAANIGMSLLGGVFSVFSNIQSLKSQSIDNKLKSIQLGSNFSDIAKSVLTDSLTEYWNGLDNPGEVSKVFDDGTWIDGLTSKLSGRLKNLPISSKSRRQIRGIIDDLIYSKESGYKEYTSWFQKTVNDTVSDLRESRNRRAKSSALPGSNLADSRALDFLSTEVYKPIIDAELELNKIQLKYNKDYFSVHLT